MRDQPSEIIKTFTPTFTGAQRYSRYKYLDAVIDADGNSYLPTPTKRFFIESPQDSFFVVTPEFENRLDLVSYKFYSTSLLWWAIAMVNHIKNPTHLEVGIILRIPPLNHIMS